MLNKEYEYEDYGKLKLVCPGIYGNGQLPLQLVKNGELYSTITVCLENEQIEENEIIIKDYSENEGMAEWCVKNNIVSEFVRMVRCGFVEVPVYKLNDKLYEDIKKEMSM